MKQTLLSRDINDLHSYLRWHSVSQFVEAGLTTLDIGCNIGTMTLEIAKQTSSLVVGIDVDERLVEHARDRAARAGLSNVEFRFGSATELPFPDESFEQILLADVLEHVEDDHRVIAECFRVLKPGGRFILNLPRPNYARLFNADWIRHIGHVRDGYELADISRLTAGMFRIEKFEFNSRAGEEFDAFYNKGRDRITDERLQMLFTLESDATREAFGLTVVATRLTERVQGDTELPRVLHVGWGHPPNCAAGPIYYLQQLCLEQQAQGMHVACFVAGNDQGSPNKPPTLRREVHEGVVYAVVENRPAHYFDWANPQREANNGVMEKLFEEVLELWQPDIVHFHNLVGLSLSLPAIAKEFGAATVLSAHNYWTICTRDDLFTPAEKVCAGPEDGTPCAACTGNPHLVDAYRMRTARSLHILNESLDLIIGVSSRVKEILRRAGVEENKIIVQHIGSRAAEKIWETVGSRRRAEGPTSRPVRFAFVGTMLPRKGAHVVIEAVKLLLDKRGEFVVHMHGGGLAASYKQRLDSLMASEPQLAECVQFKGGYFQQQLPDVLREIDVAIIPPVWEDNGPQTVMEALAAGVPVIGANIGGIPDFVHHGHNGFLFTAGNPTELASVMRTLIDDPSIIDTLKSAIREPISMARHARELQKIYAQKLVPAFAKRHDKRTARRRIERYANDALELLDLKRRYAELEAQYRQAFHPGRLAAPIQQSSERTVDTIVQEASRLVDEGKNDQAVARLEQGFAQFKGAAKLHFALYELLKLQERHEEAEWHFALAQACDPSLAEIHNEFGVRAYRNGDVKLALRNFERAVRLNRRCIAPRKNLAELYIQLERPSDAIPLLRDVLYLAPDDVEAMKLLGHVCIRLSELEDALFFFEKSVERDPADETTKEIIAALRAKGVVPRVSPASAGACLSSLTPKLPAMLSSIGPRSSSRYSARNDEEIMPPPKCDPTSQPLERIP